MIMETDVFSPESGEVDLLVAEPATERGKAKRATSSKRRSSSSTAEAGGPNESDVAISRILIPRPNFQMLDVPIVGTTPLILHKWSEKAIAMIRDKQMKKAVSAKGAKDPEAEFNGARYISAEGWDGAPAVAFKAAMVGACRQTGKAISMTLAQRLFFVVPEAYLPDGTPLVRIYGEPRIHESMVRVGQGIADIRYRPIYMPWSANLRIQYNADVISAEQVVNLLQLAGLAEGVGEWRPSAPRSYTGTFGCWMIGE